MSALLQKIATGTAFWLPLTVALYCVASEAHRRAGKTPLLNPTLLAIAGVCATLFALQVPHAVYFESVSILHYLLGTAVVALAVPLYRNLERLARAAWPILLALVACSLTSILAGLLIALALGASTSTLLSLAPKSATAAVSMEIARGIGGAPALTACLTIATGIIGAVLGPYVLTWAGVTSSAARGIALGTASHGIATARAFGECELAGCCASLAMGLNAVLTALATPLLAAALRVAQ